MRSGSSNNKIANKRNNISNLTKFYLTFSVILLIFAFFIPLNNYDVACAEGEESIEEELSQTTQDILEDIDFSELEELLESSSDFNLLGNKSFKEFVYEVISGEQTVEIGSIFNLILSGVKESFKSVLSPLSIILSIALLCYMFNNFKANSNQGVGEIIYFICFAVIVIILSFILKGIIENTQLSLNNLVKQMNIVFPILISLISVAGGAVTVKAYSPIVAFLSNAISNVFLNVLMPLFVLSLVLSIVGHLSPKTKLDKLNGFIHSLFKWIIGVVFAIFMGYLSIKGITAGSADGISIKATKYAIKNYIPMLGGYISDGFELVKAGGLLVKNATGFASIILLISTIISPALSIGIIELGLKFLAGVLEPVDGLGHSSLLYAVAKSLKLLVVIIVGVALMYFLTTYLIMCSASNFI